MASTQFKQTEEFKALTEEVGIELTADNVTALKQLLQEQQSDIKMSPDSLNKAKDGKHLLKAMMHKGIFHNENMEELGRFMKEIERVDLFRKIEEYTNKVNELKFGTNLVNVSYPETHFFKTGKCDELANSINNSQIVLLTGVSGSGKTQLSLQFAKEFIQQEGKYSVTWQLAAANKEELLTSLFPLCEQLKIPRAAGAGTKDKLQAIKDTLKDVFEKLSTQEFCHLLLLDNLNDISIFQCVLQGLDNQKYGNIKLIVTSNNQNLIATKPHFKHIEVKGFSKYETLGFFYQHKEFTDIKEEDILSLAENLSYLPLGLAPAISYIMSTKITPKAYLDLLTDPTSSALLEKNEKKQGFLSGYDLPVLKALQMAISKFESSLKHPNLYLMHEVACLFHYQDILLCTLSTVLPAENRNLNVDDFINSFVNLSVGYVNGNDEMRSLTMHKAIQHATRLTWSDEKRVQVTEKALLLLCRNFDKDTRFMKQFSSTVSLVHHVSEALRYTETFMKPEQFEKSNSIFKKAFVARILLLDVLGYTYTQIGRPQLSEGPLCKAKDTLYNLINFERMNANPSEVARILYEKLSKISLSFDDSDIMSLVLNRCLTEQDLQIVNARLRDTSSPLSEQLSRGDYDTMVRYGAAMPRAILSKIFLPEIMASVLYSYGRIYFYMKGECNGDSDGLAKKSVFFEDMQIAHDLSKVMCCDTDSKFHILHETLTLRNALLYLKLEELDVHGRKKSVDDFKADLLKARQTYETEAKNTNDYYQFGILKTKKDDSYGKMVCLRQILLCYKLLQKIDPSTGVIQETRAHVSNMLQLADELRDKASLVPNIYNTAAEIELLSNSSEGKQKALELYTKSIDFQQNVAHQKNYVLLNALIGLAEVKIDLPIHTDNLLDARSRVDEAKALIKEMWPGNIQDSEKCTDLLVKIEAKLTALGLSNVQGFPVSCPQSR